MATQPYPRFNKSSSAKEWFRTFLLLLILLGSCTSFILIISRTEQMPRSFFQGRISREMFSVHGLNNGTYLIAIVDPDAPSRANPTISQIRHMFATDFVLSDIRPNFATRSLVLRNSTAAISPYFPPNPPVGSGAHRYVALLYAQPNNFDIASLNAAQVANFNIASFAASAGLGEPLAGTFLTVEQKA
ncbi:hypothetical protein ACGC1H_005355 [Rhizoctonia solani]